MFIPYLRVYSTQWLNVNQRSSLWDLFWLCNTVLQKWCHATVLSMNALKEGLEHAYLCCFKEHVYIFGWLWVCYTFRQKWGHATLLIKEKKVKNRFEETRLMDRIGMYVWRNPVSESEKNLCSSQPLFFPSQEPQKFQVPPSKSESRSQNKCPNGSSTGI